MLLSLETSWLWCCVTMFWASLRSLAQSHAPALFAILVGKCNGVRWPFASTMASTVAARSAQDGVEWRRVGTGGGRFATKQPIVSDHEGDCISKTWFSCQYGYRIIHSNCVHIDWKRFWNKCGLDVFPQVKYQPFFPFHLVFNASWSHHNTWLQCGVLLKCRVAKQQSKYINNTARLHGNILGYLWDTFS